MKKLILIMTVFIFSCNKEEVMPAPEFELKIDNVLMPGLIPYLKTSGNQNELKASTEDESIFMSIDLGDEIKSQVFNPNPIQGDLDPVYIRTSSVNYYLIDSGAFYISIEDSEGYYNGSFYGSLSSQSNNQLELSGSFSNL